MARKPLETKEARHYCRASLQHMKTKRDYGFFLPIIVSFFIVVSILCVVSIFMPVSAAAAGAGAGAIAGVAVSGFASSFEHAVTASTAATKARRFMTFS